MPAGLIVKEVSSFPIANDPTQFDIFGVDRTTGYNAKATMSTLKGDVGPSPNISIAVNALPYGSQPTVTKSGTDIAPLYTFGIPMAQNGQTPEFRYSGGYIQYRYGIGSWINLVPISDLIQPALTAATNANNAATAANTATGRANTATTNANNAATAANTAAQGAITATTNADNATIDAISATTNANNAAEAANTAAANVQDGKTPIFSSGATSTLLPEQPATVTITNTGVDESGNPTYTISIGVPQGVRGKEGFTPILINGTIQTGAAGSSSQLTFTYSGTDSSGAPIYRIDGSIPQGHAGDGNGNVEVIETGLMAGVQYAFVPDNNDVAIGTFQEITIPTQVQADYGQTLTTSPDYIKNKPNLAPEFVTSNAYSSTPTGVSETVQMRSIQNGIGTPVTIQLPVATAEQAGVMPAATYAQIQTNNDRISALEQQGGKYIGQSFPTKADLNNYVIPSSVNIGDFTFVQTDEDHNNATTRYIVEDSGSGKAFVFAYIIESQPIGIATETDLGIVKGSAIDGQQMVESDGTMSTVGWDALKQRVTNNETGLLTKQDTLTAGSGITIENNVISSNGGGGGLIIAGDGITVTENTVAVNNTVVRTSGVQTITGNKTFNNDILCNSIRKRTSGTSAGNIGEQYNKFANGYFERVYVDTPTVNVTGLATNKGYVDNLVATYIKTDIIYYRNINSSEANTIEVTFNTIVPASTQIASFYMWHIYGQDNSSNLIQSITTSDRKTYKLRILPQAVSEGWLCALRYIPDLNTGQLIGQSTNIIQFDFSRIL